MFGIIDYIYTGVRISPFYKNRESNHDRRVDFNSGNESWYCFVPRSVSENNSIKKGIIPGKGKVIVYSMSAPQIITRNTDEILRHLDEIYCDAKERIEEDVREGREINVMGVSLGNVLAIRSVSEILKGNVNNLVSLVGGGRLGLSAWDSILTRRNARNSGYKKSGEYEKRLEIYSPLNYTERIHAVSLLARFGTSDLLIPYYPHGQELHESLLKVKSDKKDIKVFRHADHATALYFASMEKINEKF